MDEHGNLILNPATEHDISEWANLYQKKYFPGWPEPNVHIKIIPDTGGTACYDPINKIAYIDARICASHKFTKIALLHEMVHINLANVSDDPDKDHGRRFKAETMRLMQAGAYNDLL